MKHLVTAHNGTVTIASASEGQGIEVILQLPIVCERTGKVPMTAWRKMASMRILLVDDGADATEALGTLSEQDGHEVKRAQNGPDALRIVESFTPDVALIGISIPDMGGVALAQLLRLRARCSQTKLVALTGYANSASRLQSDERLFEPSPRQAVVAR
ncbi:hypothetical protein R75465_06548 [Paraburkholderia aspalathi]|uniref:response regulator n=1 Tax=Paraburkholderia aspalathi TaxID=1324617 RepID=UPI001B0245DB|nr:response regulator [Paraburkholderia aspalathi]CAE6837361.1 hypothetical protein R75465_06548 [Paraburkholderia aspalathi]